jgi:hypothetical protein
MSRHLSRAESAQLGIGLLTVAATFAAFAVGSGLADAAVSAGLVLALLVVVAAGRHRSGTLDVMSGIGDERSRSLYLRSTAFTGTVMSFVLPGWWLATVAQGDPNETLTVLCAIMGVTFLVSVAAFARRG